MAAEEPVHETALRAMIFAHYNLQIYKHLLSLYYSGMNLLQGRHIKTHG